MLRGTDFGAGIGHGGSPFSCRDWCQSRTIWLTWQQCMDVRIRQNRRSALGLLIPRTGRQAACELLNVGKHKRLAKSPSMNNELTTTESPALAHRHATDVAGVVREFALKRCVTIGGKKYPPVEVWQSIANSFGCVASATNVEVVDGGIRAIGEVRRISDGTVIATGEGFVGEDESLWMKRPMYARRAMAQTRSISRACRAAFAFVVPMIDEGLGTTPAEEMEAVTVESSRIDISKAEKPVRQLLKSVSVQEGEVTRFTDRLVDVVRKEGTSKGGKAWKAGFMRFENREEEPGTFDVNLADNAEVLKGQTCEVRMKPSKTKEGAWELLSIEPADEIPMDVPH